MSKPNVCIGKPSHRQPCSKDITLSIHLSEICYAIHHAYPITPSLPKRMIHLASQTSQKDPTKQRGWWTEEFVQMYRRCEPFTQEERVRCHRSRTPSSPNTPISMPFLPLCSHAFASLCQNALSCFRCCFLCPDLSVPYSHSPEPKPFHV